MNISSKASSFSKSYWKWLIASSALPITVLRADPVQYDVVQVGESTYGPWRLDIEASMTDATDETTYNYLRQLDTVPPAQGTHFFVPGNRPSVLSIQAPNERLHLFAPSVHNAYYIQDTLTSTFSTVPAFGALALNSPGIVPAHLMLEAGNGESYTVNTEIAFDPLTELTINTCPDLQDTPSVVTLNGGLTGQGILTIQGGGEVRITGDSSNFAGDIALESQNNQNTKLSVLGSLSVRSLIGEGEVSLNSTTGGINFQVPSDQSPAYMQGYYTEGSAAQYVVKTGSGTLEAYSTNSIYTGGTRVQEGTLKLKSSSTFQASSGSQPSVITGPVGLGPIHISLGATLDVAEQTLDNDIGSIDYGYSQGTITNSRFTPGILSTNSRLYLGQGHELRSGSMDKELHVMGTIFNAPVNPQDPSSVIPPIRITGGTVLLGGQSSFQGLRIEGGVVKVGAATESVSGAQSYPGAFSSGPLGRNNDHDNPLNIMAVVTNIRSGAALDVNGFDIYNPILLAGTLRNTHETQGATIYSKVGLDASTTYIDGGISSEPLRFSNTIRSNNSTYSLHIHGGQIHFEALDDHAYGDTQIGNTYGDSVSLTIHRAGHLPGNAEILDGASLIVADGILELGTQELQKALLLYDRATVVFQEEGHETNDPQNPTTSHKFYGYIAGLAQDPYAYRDINIPHATGIVSITDGIRCLPGAEMIAASFAKKGPGSLILEGTSTATGILYIHEGTVAMAAYSSFSEEMSLGLGAGVFSVENMCSQENNPVSITMGSIYGSGGGTIRIGPNILRSVTNSATICDATLLGLGSFMLDGAGSLTLTEDLSDYRGSLKVGPQATLHLSNNARVKTLGSGTYVDNQEVENAGLITIVANKELMIANNATPAIITNPIAGMGSVNVNMDGETAYFQSNPRSYTGGTHIQSGYLIARGETVRNQETNLVDSGPLGLGTVTTSPGGYLVVEAPEIANNLILEGVLRVQVGDQESLTTVFSGESIVLNASSPIVDVLTGCTATVTASLSTMQGLTKHGRGSLSLSNPNSQIDGLITVHEGELIFSNTVPTGDIILHEEARLHFLGMDSTHYTLQGNLTSNEPAPYVTFTGGQWDIIGNIDFSSEDYTLLLGSNTSCLLHHPAQLPSKISAFGGGSRLIFEFDDVSHLTLNTILDGGWGAEVHKYGKSILTIPGANIYDFRSPFYAHEGTTIITEPETFLNNERSNGLGNSALVASGGAIKIQSLLDSPQMHMYSLEVQNQGIFDFEFSRRFIDPSTMSFSIHHMTAGSGSIHLRIDSLSAQDTPLLKFQQSWTGRDPNFSIKILPKSIFGTQSSHTVNILALGEDLHEFMTGSEYTGFKEWLMSKVDAGAFFSFDSASFSTSTIPEFFNAQAVDVPYDVLSAVIRPKTITEIFEHPDLSGLDGEYQSLGKAIFTLGQSSEHFAETEIFQTLAQASSSADLGRKIIGLFSTEIHSAMRAFLSKKGSRTNAQLSEDSSIRDMKALMRNQNFSTATINRLSQLSVSSHRTMTKAMGVDSNPEEQIRQIDYSSLDIAGLSFATSTSYSHETQSKQSEDKPGFTQTSWASSLSASYNIGKMSAIAVSGLTSHSHQNLNANQYQKTDTRDDRYNALTLTSLIQGAESPWALTAAFSYGQHHYEQTRTWEQESSSNPTYSIEASSAYAAYETSGTFEVRWKWNMNDKTIMQPYAGYNVTHTQNQDYIESAINLDTNEASLYGMIVPKQSATSHQQSIGVEFLHVTQFCNTSCQLRSRLGFSTEKVAGGDTLDFTFAYESAPSEELTIAVPIQRYNTLDITLGFHGCVKDNLFFSTLYTGQYGQYQNTSTAMVSLEYYLG